jgi:hypothetical protein
LTLPQAVIGRRGSTRPTGERDLLPRALFVDVRVTAAHRVRGCCAKTRFALFVLSAVSPPRRRRKSCCARISAVRGEVHVCRSAGVTSAL